MTKKSDFLLICFSFFLSFNILAAEGVIEDSDYFFDNGASKKEVVSKEMIDAVIGYEKKNKTPNTLDFKKLKNCLLEARRFELGDGSNTQEWLISTPKSCSIHKKATSWVIQNKRQQIKVLASMRGQISISQLRRNGS